MKLIVKFIKVILIIQLFCLIMIILGVEYLIKNANIFVISIFLTKHNF